MFMNTSRMKYQCVFLCLTLGVFASTAPADTSIRESMESGVCVALQNGNRLFLECSPPPEIDVQAFWSRYLADGGLWRRYAPLRAAALNFECLSPEARRHALLTIFPLDYIDENGWWHTVRVSCPGGGETIAALAGWLTGSENTCDRILACEQNSTIREPLQRGDQILVPQPLLLPVMRAFKEKRPLPVVSVPPPKTLPKTAPQVKGTDPGPMVISQEETAGKQLLTPMEDDTGQTPGIAFPFVNGNTEGLLEYHDGHAVYKLQAGESLYSAVVVRFTDYWDNQSILAACGIIAQHSGIQDVHCIPAGQKIIIPMEMLSARFQPQGSEQRIAYEAVREEEQRLKKDRVYTKDLAGIVIVLDSGHGGRDHGAAKDELGLYEDEINYDIVCRIKALLEKQTNAEVYVTIHDPKQNYAFSEATSFSHDTRELLKTTPSYNLWDQDTSITLRWNLANYLYHRERKKGTDPRKVVFASIHCDYLFNETLRGAMVYVPGAAHRNDKDVSTSATFSKYKEVSRDTASKSTKAERKRDEALSRLFAAALIQSMRTNQPPLKVHDAGDPIRSVIRRGETEVFLPGVLRYNNIPTKVLVEVANMNNKQDQQRLSNPLWRQWFAKAFVNALRATYNH